MKVRTGLKAPETLKHFPSYEDVSLSKISRLQAYAYAHRQAEATGRVQYVWWGAGGLHVGPWGVDLPEGARLQTTIGPEGEKTDQPRPECDKP